MKSSRGFILLPCCWQPLQQHLQQVRTFDPSTLDHSVQFFYGRGTFQPSKESENLIQLISKQFRYFDPQQIHPSKFPKTNKILPFFND